MPSSLPYEEPGMLLLLKQSSFILALNAINHALDSFIYCGLVGQILIGVAWGTPGAKLLSTDAEHVVVQLGYIGLILIVFEGGLSTNFSHLRANLPLSCGVALTGILAPIALSFVLSPMASASSLQAFAAGAALCSTSLGTTFTLLGSSGLGPTRLGVVLTSAAMMDDVVGLIMVQIIANLGSSSGSLDPVTVVRPILVSLAFALLLPLACRWVVMPARRWLSGKDRAAWFVCVLQMPKTALIFHVMLLVGMVTGATYAGTSGLLGAYIAGAIISWWDAGTQSKVKGHSHFPTRQGMVSGSLGTPEGTCTSLGNTTAASPEAADEPAQPESPPGRTGVVIFERYIAQALRRILKPFFFASIGFSIPISQMFAGPIVWRGFVYAALMILGKLLCGVLLLRLPSFADKFRAFLGGIMRLAKLAPARRPSSVAKKPLSVYPSLILGSAMVARGEIGYLISSTAETRGVFSKDSMTDGPSDVFLMATWAITICTVVGPVCMGLLVTRLKKLEKPEAPGRTGKESVLGDWGVR